MNAAEKQEASVAKALGSLAYESVFVYPTDNESWTQIFISEDSDLTQVDVAMLFGSEFTITTPDCDDRSLFIRNNKLAKVAA